MNKQSILIFLIVVVFCCLVGCPNEDTSSTKITDNSSKTGKNECVTQMSFSQDFFDVADIFVHVNEDSTSDVTFRRLDKKSFNHTYRGDGDFIGVIWVAKLKEQLPDKDKFEISYSTNLKVKNLKTGVKNEKTIKMPENGTTQTFSKADLATLPKVITNSSLFAYEGDKFVFHDNTEDLIKVKKHQCNSNRRCKYSYY